MRALAVALLMLLPLAGAVPEQVHLGLPDADASTSRSVLYVDLDPEPSREVLLRGPDGRERTVEAREVSGPGAGSTFEAVLEGLMPGAAYEYDVGGRTFGFRTPPTNLSDAGAVRMVALGDMGVTDDSRATFAKIETFAPDLVLHAGDISYGEGNPATWKTWFDLVEPVAAQTPWVTALGNHETYSSLGTGAGGFAPPSPIEIAFYQQRFGLPRDELAFSFDWAGVHVVALDTFSAQGIAQAQVKWLAEDLADARASGAAWTIAFLHEPPYSSNSHGSSARVQDAFIPILEAAGVDLVVAAHDHAYERSFPMRGGEPVVTEGAVYEQGSGIVYVVTGGGGESLYAGWETPAPAWSAARKDAFHVSLIEATPERLRVEFVPTGDAGGFADAFEIRRASVEPQAVTPPGVDLPAPGVALLVVALASLALLRRRS